MEEREHQDFEKTLGWSKFSKEDTTRVELGEIRQRTVTELTLKELLPHRDYPHPGIIQYEKDPHLQVTHSLSTAHTMRESIGKGKKIEQNTNPKGSLSVCIHSVCAVDKEYT
jgi:hypothetical protein